MNASETRTSPALVALAWILVVVPLGWGIYRSVLNSLPLFEGHSAPHAMSH